MVFSALANKLLSSFNRDPTVLAMSFNFSLARPEIKEKALPSPWAKATLHGPCVSGHVVHRSPCLRHRNALTQKAW